MYIVVELQKTAENTLGNFVWSYSSKAEAESKYHAVLSAAAVSAVPVHSAVLLSEQGYAIASQCYIHEAV